MSAQPGTHIYTFRSPNGRLREFGPYADEIEASEAFQRIYGYWPSEPVVIRRYVEGEAR